MRLGHAAVLTADGRLRLITAIRGANAGRGVAERGKGKVYAVEWLNEPPAWEARGETLIVTVGPQTDFWRTTHYGFVRDTGHLWFRSWSSSTASSTRAPS
jgi:hypothetical protein